MRQFLLSALAVAVGACSSPDTATSTTPEDSASAAPHAADGFDAQAWLAEAREASLSTRDPELDPSDEAEARVKALANDLNEAADWRRACDTTPDLETGEMVHDPIPPGQGHWVRGILEVADISETEAIVAVTCDFGAYQGSYAFVHVADDRAAVLSSPRFNEDDELTDQMSGTFGTPDFSRVREGTIGTFHRARGLGDCGLYFVYELGASDILTVREVRERDCGDTIPDDLPPPTEWPVVYSAG